MGLEGFLEEIRSQLTDAQVAHFDETGGRIEGRLSYIHSASTEQLTLYTVHSKRGVEAMTDAGVLERFRGCAVHDGWAPYRTFTQALHALCNAHHLRELLAAEEAGQLWALGMSCLLLDTKELVERAQAAGRKRLAEQTLQELHASYREVIKTGYEQNPESIPTPAGAVRSAPRRRTCCCAWTSTRPKRCASRTISGSRSTTTSSSGTCE